MKDKALRRIPLEKFIDLKVDYAFKQLLVMKRIKSSRWFS